jgi:hypothetical protein
MADKIQARDDEAHEKDVRRGADVFRFQLAETARLGARVADGTAVVDSGAVGLGGPGVQLLQFGTNPPGGLRLRMIRQRTSSLIFVVSPARLQGRERDSNPLIRVCKFDIWLLFPRHLRWRPEPESNRRARICSPLRNHSAIGPPARKCVGSGRKSTGGPAGFAVRARTPVSAFGRGGPADLAGRPRRVCWHASCCRLAHVFESPD